jgi:histidinol-phosphate aminotransferase
MPKSPADLIRPEILGLAAYHVQDATGMVKLDAMENPYALPGALRAEVAAAAAAAALNRYPDPDAARLKARLKAAMDVPAGAELLLGNGSDELIQMLALACARPGAVILGVEPSFVMFRLIAQWVGARYVGVPLRADFGLDPAALGAALEREQPALVFLACPNNPTGNLFDAAAVAQVVARAPGLVIVDEAYHAFAGRTFMPRLADHPNLLVMRTLSKLGLAGLRLGLLAGAPQWLDQLDKVRLPYNVNVLTQCVAEAVLGHADVLEAQAAAIRAERSRLAAALAARPGVTAFDSDANFILFRVPGAQRVFEGLKERGVLIKNLAGSHPLLENCLRVTVGTPQENAAFLAALDGALRK